jgi:hypothetical protein
MESQIFRPLQSKYILCEKIRIRGHSYRTSAPKGEGGVSQKGTRGDVGVEGQWENADVCKIENYLKFFLAFGGNTDDKYIRLIYDTK